MSQRTGGALHVVVFDVNVYLDAAKIVGAPFAWERLTAVAARCHEDPLPSRDVRVDAVRAISVATSQDFAGPDLLQVWTSNPIDAMVRQKAISELGWSTPDAERLVDELVWTLVWDKTGGSSVGDVVVPWHKPPLDHEDGCVYAAARDAGFNAPQETEVVNYCVTGDKQFRREATHSNVTTLLPWEWVDLVRRSRARAAMGSMFPRGD